MNAMEELREAIERGDAAAAAAATTTLVDGGRGAADILDNALLPAMALVGRRFRDREIFLPDVLIAARAMKGAMAIIEPLLLTAGVAKAGKVVLGTIRGDLHDIGKNLVSVMLQGAGYEVIDLGADVEPDAFVDAAVEAGAPVIGMSALLTTTMTGMAEVIRSLDDRGLRGQIRTIVGGAPVNASFAAEIGADAYAPDASAAVDKVKQLIEGRLLSV